MLRHIVTAYLVLVAAAGPGLCCCTIYRALGASACGSVAASAEDRHGCCCHHGEPASTRTTDDGASEAPRQDGKPRHCPCKDRQAIPVALLEREARVAAPLTIAAAWDYLLLTAGMAPLSWAHPAGSEFTGNHHSAPFETGSEILRALCVMRC